MSECSDSSSGGNKTDLLAKKRRNSAKDIQALVKRQQSAGSKTPDASSTRSKFENLPAELHDRIANKLFPSENSKVAKLNKFLEETYLPHAKWQWIRDYVTPVSNDEYSEIFSDDSMLELADSQTIEARLRELLKVAPGTTGCILDMPAEDRANVFYEIFRNCPEESKELAYALSRPHVLKLPLEGRKLIFADMFRRGGLAGEREERFCLDILSETGGRGDAVSLKKLAINFGKHFGGLMTTFRSILELSARDDRDEIGGHSVRMTLAQRARRAENHYAAVDALADNPKHDSDDRHAKLLRVLYRFGKKMVDWWQPERRITPEQWTSIEARIATAAKLLGSQYQQYVFEEDNA